MTVREFENELIRFAEKSNLKFYKPIVPINNHLTPEIENVIFNKPATIVFWTDGTKTVVKAENEPFDEEKGLAMAIAKKALGNRSSYYDEIRKWLPTIDATPVKEDT